MAGRLYTPVKVCAALSIALRGMEPRRSTLTGVCATAADADGDGAPGYATEAVRKDDQRCGLAPSK